jgi:hypothetical protein
MQPATFAQIEIFIQVTDVLWQPDQTGSGDDQSARCISVSLDQVHRLGSVALHTLEAKGMLRVWIGLPGRSCFANCARDDREFVSGF